MQGTRKLASVRIHVEKVIELIRHKLILLNSLILVDYVAFREDDVVTPVDKIVCSVLSHLCPPTVAALKGVSEEQASVRVEESL